MSSEGYQMGVTRIDSAVADQVNLAGPFLQLQRLTDHFLECIGNSHLLITVADVGGYLIEELAGLTRRVCRP